MKLNKPIKLLFGILLGISIILVLGYIQPEYGIVWYFFRPRLKTELLAPNFLQPSILGENLQLFSPENIAQLQEVESFRLSKALSPVIAVSEDSDQQWIMAINGEGEFVHWEIASRQIIREFDFYAAYPGNANFSEDGSRLLASRSIWNTQSGQVVYCARYECEITIRLRIRPTGLGYLIQQGTWK